MAGFGKGMGFLRTQTEKIRSGTFGSGFNKANWLRTGESVVFWFITEAEDVVVPLIHLKPVSGRGGKTFKKDVLCDKLTMDDDDETPCAMCEAPDNEDGRNPFGYRSPRGVYYVYVEAKFHPEKTDEKWETVSVGGQPMYKEVVSAVQIIVAKRRLIEQIMAAASGDQTDPDFDADTPQTLLDRPFRLQRIGDRQQAQEILTSGKARKRPEAIAEASASLMSMDDLCVAEFSDGTPKAAATVAKGSGKDETPTDDFEPAAAAATTEPEGGKSDDSEPIDF